MGQVKQLRRRLVDELPRYALAHEVPGVSVAVLVEGQVLAGTAGVVNVRTEVPVKPDALFMIQSVTKVWTATLVMQLVDEGLIELDALVRAYLPGFRTADERAGGQITVRHLLTHTGGFEGDIWAPTTAGEDALQRFVEDLVSRAPQHTRPGAMYSYCNAGFGVLGRIVEVMRNTSYAGALRRYLAEPLGITELAFSANEALRFRTAIGHARMRPEAALEPLKCWAVMPPSNPAAGNQLAMSARALIAFAQMHLRDGEGPDGTRMLSAASAQAMRQCYVAHPAAIGAAGGSGLGWMLPPRTGLVEHGGDAIGVAALLRIAPQRGVAVVILTNGGNAGGLIEDVLELLLPDLAHDTPVPALPSPPADAQIRLPGRYVGSYQTRQSLLEVAFDDSGHLWLTEFGRNEALTIAHAAGVSAEPQRHQLRPGGGDTFVLTEPSGSAIGAIEFIGSDTEGRARFLHTGRAAPRID